VVTGLNVILRQYCHAAPGPVTAADVVGINPKHSKKFNANSKKIRLIPGFV
jgi:hypothetical protein